MSEIGVGIIGTGFMGMTHAYAYRAAAGYFPGSLRPVLRSIADIDGEAAARAKDQLGALHSTANWQDLVEDPAVAILSITTPNVVHRDMALAAAKAGKHIHCEKPLAPSAGEAEEMMLAAESAGVVTQAGFNYVKNPVLKLAREMIGNGELGEILSFRGIHAEDYMADPDAPWSWRLDPAAAAA